MASSRSKKRPLPLQNTSPTTSASKRKTSSRRIPCATKQRNQFDQEDCLEGLYHDALAARLEAEIQEGIVEELWDIGLEQHEVTRKGGRLAKKLSPKHTENILITSGKALFVRLPEVTSNP